MPTSAWKKKLNNRPSFLLIYFYSRFHHGARRVTAKLEWPATLIASLRQARRPKLHMIDLAAFIATHSATDAPINLPHRQADLNRHRQKPPRRKLKKSLQ